MTVATAERVTEHRYRLGEVRQIAPHSYLAAGVTFGRRTPDQAVLERFFFLDDADRDLVAKRRGDHNRLGFVIWSR